MKSGAAAEREAIEDTAFWRTVPNVVEDIAEARSERGVALDQFVVAGQERPVRSGAG